jgi:hypothetical protein
MEMMGKVGAGLAQSMGSTGAAGMQAAGRAAAPYLTPPPDYLVQGFAQRFAGQPEPSRAAEYVLANLSQIAKDNNLSPEQVLRLFEGVLGKMFAQPGATIPPGLQQPKAPARSSATRTKALTA